MDELRTEALRESATRERARRYLKYFIQYTYKTYIITKFHAVYCHIIQAFINGKIRKLIISVPPQHGKSEVVTRRLPPYLLGLNPSLKIAIVTYSQQRSWRLGRDIKRIMTGPEYKNVFPKTVLPEHRDVNYSLAADIVDIPAGDKTGNLFFVGRGGGLTGESVDILIIDDIFKNSSEANSPVIRQNIVDWYNTVAESRLHNDSQVIVVNTRWHNNDLTGYIIDNENVELLRTHEQIENANRDRWYSINFEALKETDKTELDAREMNEALFPEKHDAGKLLHTRDRLMKTDPEKWRSLYQGDPRPITGLLYGPGFKTWERLPDIEARNCYIDVADQGDNRLCAICYGKGFDGYIYIIDVYHTVEPQEVTEIGVCDMLNHNKINTCYVESNAGGRAFARNLQRILLSRKTHTDIIPFNQSQNKEARILTNASNVMQYVLMPPEWMSKYSLFATELLDFRKIFKSNKYDDAADGLTGVFERCEHSESEVFVGTA